MNHRAAFLLLRERDRSTARTLSNAGKQSPNEPKRTRWIKEAMQRVKRNGRSEARVRSEPHDALTGHPPTEAFGLVVTHFLLDCLRCGELQQVVEMEEG